MTERGEAPGTGDDDLAASLASLRPDPAAADRWVADRHVGGGLLDRLHGGEMVAHIVTLAQARAPGRGCVSFEILFVREARCELPTEYTFTDLSAGRTYAFTTVAVTQPGRGLVAHARVTLAGPRTGPSHQAFDVPDVDWDGAADEERGLLAAPIAVVGQPKLDDGAVGDPVVRLWLRMPPGLTGVNERRTYVAYATDQLMMSAAVRPHAGMSYVTAGVYAAVISHSVRFWGDALPDGDLRLDITSPVMTDGAALVVAHAFDGDGRLVATCVQDLVVRPANGAGTPAASPSA